MPLRGWSIIIKTFITDETKTNQLNYSYEKLKTETKYFS